MRQVRPTLKVIKQLPRDSFVNPSEVDKVSSLGNASREAREQILSSLRLYRVQHPLLTDARSYFDAGSLPDLHRAATNERSRSSGGATLPVYEVRSRTGAAWRGGVIKDDAGDPWLAYANKHDEFHSSAALIFAEKSRYWPTSIDFKIRELEEEEAKRESEEISCLISMINALSHAVTHSPEQQTVTITLEEYEPFELSFEVNLAEPAASISTAHESVSDVSVWMEIDVKDFELRDRMLRLYLPFLQPDPDLRQHVYGPDRTTMIIDLMMTQAQLAQVLVTSTTGDAPQPQDIAEPNAQHFFEKRKLAAAFVYGEALKALCGVWIVPTKEGEIAEHLPVCAECERVEPVAQLLLDLAKKQ